MNNWISNCGVSVKKFIIVLLTCNLIFSGTAIAGTPLNATDESRAIVVFGTPAKKGLIDLTKFRIIK
jgi:hypothetical protein